MVYRSRKQQGNYNKKTLFLGWSCYIYVNLYNKGDLLPYAMNKPLIILFIWMSLSFNRWSHLVGGLNVLLLK